MLYISFGSNCNPTKHARCPIPTILPKFWGCSGLASFCSVLFQIYSSHLWFNWTFVTHFIFPILVVKFVNPPYRGVRNHSISPWEVECITWSVENIAAVSVSSVFIRLFWSRMPAMFFPKSRISFSVTSLNVLSSSISRTCSIFSIKIRNVHTWRSVKIVSFASLVC